MIILLDLFKTNLGLQDRFIRFIEKVKTNTYLTFMLLCGSFFDGVKRRFYRSFNTHCMNASLNKEYRKELRNWMVSFRLIFPRAFAVFGSVRQNKSSAENHAKRVSTVPLEDNLHLAGFDLARKQRFCSFNLPNVCKLNFSFFVTLFSSRCVLSFLIFLSCPSAFIGDASWAVLDQPPPEMSRCT